MQHKRGLIVTRLYHVVTDIVVTISNQRTEPALNRLIMTTIAICHNNISILKDHNKRENV